MLSFASQSGTLLFLAPLFLSAVWVSCSPGCASCGSPGLGKDVEEKLMIELAKQQLLDKLHLKERPNITQAVPRVALLTALRKLHSGRVRQDGTLELQNSVLIKDQGYEILSFADISKFCFHLLHREADILLCVAHRGALSPFMHCAQIGSELPCASSSYLKLLCFSIKCCKPSDICHGLLHSISILQFLLYLY